MLTSRLSVELPSNAPGSSVSSLPVRLLQCLHLYTYTSLMETVPPIDHCLVPELRPCQEP